MNKNDTSKPLRNKTTEIDMLKGNINRMCVTDDVGELNNMFEHAAERLSWLFDYNYERIKNNNMQKSKK